MLRQPSGRSYSIFASTSITAHGATDRPFILYGRSGQVTIGVYIGQGLLNQGLSASALAGFHDSLDTLEVTTPSLGMQLCGPSYDSTHIFGVVTTSNATFVPIQNAIKSWANGNCLPFVGSKKLPGKSTFTTPLLKESGTRTNFTMTNSTVHARHNSDMPARVLQARADCRTVQVASGDGCAELAVRCGISGADFTKYNPGICATLKPKQHVC